MRNILIWGIPHTYIGVCVKNCNHVAKQIVPMLTI